MNLNAGRYLLTLTTVTANLQIAGKAIALRILASPLSSFGGQQIFQLFVPLGSDSLITADNLTFKVKE